MVSNTTATVLLYLAVGVSVGTLIAGIAANIRVSSYHYAGPKGGSLVHAPTFRVKGNMVALDDGTLCVESAALPQGVSLKKSPARRVEGRFYTIRAGDLGKHKRKAPIDEVVSAPVPAVGSCVEPIVEGARWRAPYEVIVDPTNDAGISRDLFIDHVWRGTNEWETRAPTGIVSGQDTAGCVDGFDDDSPDGKNEIMFGYIEEQGVLAVTVIWGIFGGPVEEREIFETDMLFNLHFPWGNASSSEYDIWGIASHEHGHAIGMAHTQYDGATMFPTASAGEKHKRDILSCEAHGMCAHYGGTCTSRGHGGIVPFVDVGFGSRCGASPPSLNAAAAAAPGFLTLVATMLLAAHA